MLAEIGSSVGESSLEAELRIDFLGLPAPELPTKLRAVAFDARLWPAPLRAPRVGARRDRSLR
jgi:hypothetical protein